MYIGTVKVFKEPWGHILLLKMDWVISRIYRLQYVYIYSVKSTIVNIFKPAACWLKAGVHNWFLKFLFSLTSLCVCVCVCVCRHLRLLVITGMIWTPYDWLNMFNGFYIAAAVGMVSRCGITIGVHCETNLKSVS